MASTDKGYNPGFLGKKLALPKIDTSVCAPLKSGTGFEIQYTHYSAFVHKERRLPLMTATNIRGEAFNADAREGTEPWDYSADIDTAYQIDNRFYGNDKNTFDRGHLVRRVDPCWGEPAVAKQAEMDTFRWVNCTPQHKNLNRNGSAWFQLEQFVMEKGIKDKIADITVFAGPVLGANDLPFKIKYLKTEVPIPLVFWKVIVWKKSDNKLYAVGFMMSQWEWIKNMLVEKPAPEIKAIKKAVKPRLEDSYFETLEFSNHQTFQVPISAIEAATGIRFNWKNVTFPFIQKKFKPVEAAPVAKVFSFKTINETAGEVAALKKGIVSKAVLKKAAHKKVPLTKRQVDFAVKNGMAGAIKRFELKGIKL